MPAPTKPPNCLELRINSVEDAKAIVQHHGKILERFHAINRLLPRTPLVAIEFIVAKEVEDETEPFIDRLFRVKTFKNVVEPKNGNVLGEIPHLLPPKPKFVMGLDPAYGSDRVTTAVITIPKRRGRPPNVKV